MGQSSSFSSSKKFPTFGNETTKTTATDKTSHVVIKPYDPSKPTSEVFTRIAYLSKIFSFYGGEIYDAVFLASISPTFREAVQDYSDEMWLTICSQIKKEPGFQQVFLDVAKKNSCQLHWIVDCCFRQREFHHSSSSSSSSTTKDAVVVTKPALDPQFLFVNAKTFLHEAVSRGNLSLVTKLIKDIYAPEFEELLLVASSQQQQQQQGQENNQMLTTTIPYEELRINTGKSDKHLVREANLTILQLILLRYDHEFKREIVTQLLVSAGVRPMNVLRADKNADVSARSSTPYYSTYEPGHVFVDPQNIKFFRELLNVSGISIVKKQNTTKDDEKYSCYEFRNLPLAKAVIECEFEDTFTRYQPLIFVLLQQFFNTCSTVCAAPFTTDLLTSDKIISCGYNKIDEKLVRHFEEKFFLPLFHFYFNSTFSLHQKLVEKLSWIDHENCGRTLSFTIVERKFLFSYENNNNINAFSIETTIRLLRFVFKMSSEYNNKLFGKNRPFNYECNLHCVADLNTGKNKNGVTGLNALHRAIMNGSSLEIIKVLIEEGGAKANCKTNELYRMREQQQQQCVSARARSRVDPTKEQEGFNRTVVQLAKDYERDEEVIKYLQEKMDEAIAEKKHKIVDTLESKRNENGTFDKNEDDGGDVFYSLKEDDDDDEAIKKHLLAVSRDRGFTLEDLLQRSEDLALASRTFQHRAAKLK